MNQLVRSDVTICPLVLDWVDVTFPCDVTAIGVISRGSTETSKVSVRVRSPSTARTETAATHSVTLAFDVGNTVSVKTGPVGWTTVTQSIRELDGTIDEVVTVAEYRISGRIPPSKC